MSARTGSYVRGEGSALAQDWDNLVARRSQLTSSGRLADQGADAERKGRRNALRGDRVVPPVAVAAAGETFFLDIRNFAARSDLAVAPDDASTAESCETQKPNETHHALRSKREQYVYRSAAPRRSARTTHIGTTAHRDSSRCARRARVFVESIFRTLESVLERDRRARPLKRGRASGHWRKSRLLPADSLTAS